MQIDIEGFLTSRGLIPIVTSGWQTFEIEHFEDVTVADNHHRIEEIRQALRGTGGVYLYENAAGKCIYVGKSVDVGDRFRTHYRRSNREDRKGDRNNRHFDFWSRRVGKLTVRWFPIDREVDRQIIEIMLTNYLKPEFCDIPKAKKVISPKT